MTEYSTRAMELAQQLRDKAELNISQRLPAVAVSHDPIMAKGKKTPVVSADDITYWHEQMASGRERFTSVVEKYYGSEIKTRSRTLDTEDSLTLGAFTGILGLPLGLIGVVLSGTFFHTGGEVIAPIFVGSVLAAGFGWQPIFVIKIKKAQHLYQQLLTHTSQGLVNWMQARYGLTLSEVEANRISDSILGLDRKIPFMDTSGKPWLLKLAKRLDGYQVEEVPAAVKKIAKKKKKKKSQQLSLSKEVTSAKPVSLPDEADKIFLQIETRIGQLNQLSLSTENSHVIDRVTDDVRDAVSGYEKLHVLGAETDGEKELTRVLGLLDAELAQIIQDEIDVARGALVSHGDYVQARQKNGLQLPASPSHLPF